MFDDRRNSEEENYIQNTVDNQNEEVPEEI